MGKIAMCRVDYRLAHGQVASGWSKFLNAQKVVILDDEVVKDKLMMSMMRVGLSGIKLVAYPVERGVEEWKKDKFGPGNIIVIFREIENAYQAYQNGFHFKHINIGQVPAAEGRRRSVATIHLSDLELEHLRELHDAGVEVFNQQTISDKKYSFSDIEKAMN